MLITFLLQDNAIFLHLESLRELFVLHGLSYVLKYKNVIFFFFNIQNIKSKSRIIFSNVFQSSIFDGYFIPFRLYLFIKDLILIFFASLF